MDEEIERLVVRVRADTAAFARDVAEMRGSLEGPLAAGVDRAGQAIESGLLRAVRTGKFGFEDLRRVALSVLNEIANAALRSGIDAIGTAGRGGAPGGLLTALGTLIGSRAGRATGGPVTGSVPYLVGERGPELFVPTAAGRIEPLAAPVGPQAQTAIRPPTPLPPREVRVAITVNARAGEAPAALAQSSRQIARAVKAALAGAE